MSGQPDGPEPAATGVDPRAVARLLRQREEMGLPPLVLSRETRAAVLAAVRQAGSAVAAAPGRAPVAAGDPARPAAARPDTTSRARRTAERAAGESGPSASTRTASGGSAGRTPGPDAGTSSASPPAASAETGPDAAGTGGLPVLDLSGVGYDDLREQALGCTRCGLAGTRTQVVFSDGNPEGRLVVVGEAPGANEDRTGLPFVGQAGKLLDLMLAAVDLSREESVYICNVIKCRPPGNRNPTPQEIRACSPWLLRQLELVQPRALLAVGTFAAQLLTSSDRPLGKLRGRQHSYQGIPLVVTYHPAALLRNPGWYRATWDDLQLLRQVMD